MTILRNGAEGQSSGTGITAGNSTTSGDAFAVTLGSGAATYDNTHPGDGSMGFKFSPSGASNTFLAFTLPSSTNNAAVEFIYYHDANPSASARLCTLISSGNTGACGIALNTVGKLFISDQAGAQIAIATTALTVGHTYRISLTSALGGSGTTGTALLNYYDGAQSLTSVQQIGSSGAANIGTAAMTIARFGSCTNVNIAKSLYLDSFQATDSASIIGPLPLAATGITGSLAISAASVTTTTAVNGALSISGTAGAGGGATGITGSMTFSGTASSAGAALTSATAAGVGTTSAKVRIDATGATSAVVTAATNTGLTTGVITSSSVTLDGDGLGIATLTGLTAATDYFFGVALDGGAQADRGNFRTAVSGAHSFSFAAASCVANSGDPTVLDSIRTRTGPSGRTAEFFAHLGDLEYQNHDSASASTYLTDFRAVLARTKHKALFQAMPVEYTESDHDAWGDNCDSASAGVGTITAWRSAWARYFATYDLPAVNTDVTPYRSWVRGRVRFVMTDGRTYMSAIAATDNSSKTKLGATQKQWLKDEWTAAKAAGQAIVWFHEDGGWNHTSTFVGDDTWSAYTTERSELATFITSNGLASRIILIHGDYHNLAADDGTNSPGGISIACASPMQQTYYYPSSGITFSQGHYPTSSPGTTMYQYGWFDVTDSGGSTLTVAFTGYSNDNSAGTSADTSRITMTRTLDAFSPISGITGSLSLSGAAAAKGAATGITGSLALTGAAAAQGQATGITGALSMSGTSAAQGAATGIAGSVTFAGSAAATAPATGITGALALSGSTAAQGTAVGITGALALSGSANITTGGSGAITGSLAVNGSASATAPATGITGSVVFSGVVLTNVIMIGSLAIVGSASATAPVSVAGSLAITGSAAATAPATASGSVSVSAAASGRASAAAAGAIIVTGSAPLPQPAAAAGFVSFNGSAGVGTLFTVDGAFDITASTVDPAVLVGPTGTITFVASTALAAVIAGSMDLSISMTAHVFAEGAARVWDGAAYRDAMLLGVWTGDTMDPYRAVRILGVSDGAGGLLAVHEPV